MRILKKIIICGLLASLFLLSGCQKEENVEPTEKSKKLMIVAHPDDETIFGGAHISKGEYFIVCLTNQDNSVRREEFTTMLDATKNEGIILNFPDKRHGKRDNWKHEKENIEKKIAHYVKAKDWESITTHNVNGEYGHIHHKMTHKLVTKVCEKENLTDNLYYFAPYYKKEDLKNHTLTPLSDEKVKAKTKLAEIYQSQEKVCNNLKHIFPYEEWTAYKDTYKKGVSQNN